jgi:transcriptional regulator with XRE-family HTH domain
MKFQAQTIIDIREAKGITQAELARRMGVTRQWVQYLESGQHNPTTKTLERLFHGLEVDDPTPFFAN